MAARPMARRLRRDIRKRPAIAGSAWREWLRTGLPQRLPSDPPAMRRDYRSDRRHLSLAPLPAPIWLGSEEREIDDIQPSEHPVNNRPQDRVVGRIGNRDRQRRAEAGAVFRAFDPHAIRSATVQGVLSSGLSLSSPPRTGGPGQAPETGPPGFPLSRE